MFKKTPTKGPVPGSSKSKKSSSKDKERKKLIQQSNGETSNSSLNSEKYVPNYENSEGDISYVGFNAETISVIAEQFLNEEIDTNVCEALAEDISYKMRELLNAAALSMRHGKRNYLKCIDVDSAFRRLNLEPVYGAGLPNWITFGDPNNYSCTLTQNVDLVNISKSESTIVEPGDMGLDYKWLTQDIPNSLAGIDSTFKQYCDTIMKFSISNKDAVRQAVLKDVAKNHNIGPIIPALCNFCFLMLQNNIAYSSLTMVLQLLEAIMFNPCTSYSAEEKQITLLIYLLLQSIMNASNLMTYEVKSTCRTLGRMCKNWPIGSRIITEKITKHLPPEPFRRLTSPVISALTYIGNDALMAVFWPHLCHVFDNLDCLIESERKDVIAAILDAARLFYKQENCDRKTDSVLMDNLGEMLIPFWDLGKCLCSRNETVQKLDTSNWIQLKKHLLKSHKVLCQQHTSNRVSKFNAAFKKFKPVQQHKIQIIGYKSLPIRRKTTQQQVYQPDRPSESVSVVTGRRTLLTLKKQFITDKINRNNGMMYHI